MLLASFSYWKDYKRLYRFKLKFEEDSNFVTPTIARKFSLRAVGHWNDKLVAHSFLHKQTLEFADSKIHFLSLFFVLLLSFDTHTNIFSVPSAVSAGFSYCEWECCCKFCWHTPRDSSCTFCHPPIKYYCHCLSNIRRSLSTWKWGDVVCSLVDVAVSGTI